ncbi:MAG: GNAT family N-acetyltransferase, partial [Bacteroidota bacterium]
MKIRNLSTTSIELLTQVFNTAFKIYYVPINFTIEGMRFRIQRGRIDLRLSVGAFEDNELVAFMLSGVDNWQGQPTIYNAGTGVIPTFRGQQLVDQMYEWAIPLWREEGYTQATLEVIVENERAIRAYRRVGMQIHRKLISLKSPALIKQSAAGSTTTLCQEVDRPDWGQYSTLQSFDPSWDFCQAGVEAVLSSCRYFEWRAKDASYLQAFAIINGKSQIAQAGVSSELKGGWA